MKSKLIFIGDWPKHVIEDIKLFQKIEDRFNCKINKMDEFAYEAQIKETKIRFQFCFGPKDDLIWEERRKLRETQEAKMPYPIERIYHQGMDSTEIYYLGFCGIFKGRSNSLFLPNVYTEILFKDPILNENGSSNAKIMRKKKFDNKLIGKIKGTRCVALTSNHVLSLRYVKDRSEIILKQISDKLSKESDIIEMEGYEILNLYDSKFKGAVYYGGDKPGDKKKMLGSSKSTVSTSYEKFVSAFLKTLEIISK